MSNLPSTQSVDSSGEVKQFFDKFFVHEVSFPSNQIDAVLGLISTPVVNVVRIVNV